MNFLDYDLYILDYDGCLLDSMPMWRSSASLYIKHLGYTPAKDLDERIPIFTDRYCGEIIKEEYNIPMTVDEIMIDIDNFVDYMYPRCPLKKGALELIDILKKNNKIIVLLSASGDHILDLSMSALNLKNTFDMVKSVYNHETLSKADGSAMEYVRKYFNVSKDRMLMLDDSLSNILGAKKYGIDCVGIYDDYSSNRGLEEIKNNTICFIKMEDLTKII